MSSLWALWAANLRIASERRRALEVLSKLSDLQLLDIGLERADIDAYVRQGLPWQRRETYAVQPSGASLQGCG